MRKNKTKNTVVQVSITMERELKQRYAKLALEMDLSLSQLIRLALRKLEESKREWAKKKKDRGCNPDPKYLYQPHTNAIINRWIRVISGRP